MTLGIWFTYGPDSPCLIESAAAFRSTFPDAIVAIADDATNPIPPDVLSLIAPDIHHPTTFPRQGNLNGWPAVFGILQTIRHLCQITGADGAIKLDSDTLILADRWLDRAAPMCGFLTGLHAYLYGLAYWLRADAAATIEQSLRSRWLDPKFRAPEDQCISIEAFRAYGPAVAGRSWSEGHAVTWQYTDDEPARCRHKAVINFGNKRMTGGRCGSEQRERIALAMARFRSCSPPASPMQSPCPPPAADRLLF